MRLHFRTYDGDGTGEYTYSLKYDNGTKEKISCVEIHRTWDLVSDNDITTSSTAEMPLISFPDKARTLIVTGLMFDEIESCDLTSSLIQRYSSVEASVDVILFEYKELLNKILSGSYTACIIISYGSSGVDSEVKSIMKSEMTNAITAFTRNGGRFCVQGEGIATSLLNKCFQKKWYSATYERDINDICIYHPQLGISEKLYSTLPTQYKVKAVALSNVDQNFQLYSSSNDQYCTVVLCKYHYGRVLYFGDVNSKDSIADLIFKLCEISEEEIRSTVI